MQEFDKTNCDYTDLYQTHPRPGYPWRLHSCQGILAVLGLSTWRYRWKGRKYFHDEKIASYGIPLRILKVTVTTVRTVGT